jgi:hypothetical protein
MTSRLSQFLVALALLAGIAGVAQAAQAGRPARRPAQAIVAAADDPAAIARARAVARRTGSAVRLPRTLAEQLGVLHALAARGTRVVLAFGLDRRVAVAPVTARYPRTAVRAR